MVICLLIAILGFAIYAVSSIVTDRLLERRIKDIEEKMNGIVKRLDIPTIEDSTPTKIASLDYKELADKYGATSGSDMVNGLTYEQSKCSTCINDKGCINCENGNQYETCAEKKMLKKIVIDEGKAEMDYCFTKMMNGEKVSPAWSEEDESHIRGILSVLQKERGKALVEQYKDSISSDIDWLESLKQRCTWKPSKEHMKALHDLNLTGNISYAGQGQVLIELYNDLKKL